MKETTEFNYHGTQLRYNPETGECWRRLKAGSWKLIKPGTEAGVDTRFDICGRPYRLPRIIAEVFLNGGKPLTRQQEVGHLKRADGSHAQDRLGNLRIVSRSQNLTNQSIRSTNTSGYRGVSWQKTAGKWKAQVVSNGKISYLGLFTTPEDAALAYDKAANELHGEFARLNFSTGSC